MNKMLAAFANGQPFSELMDRLGSKWKSQTTTALPPLRLDGLASNEKVEAILRHLVAIPTTSGNHEANHNAIAFIKEYFDSYKLHTQVYTWNNVKSLVVAPRPTKTPKVLFSAHLDVVPAKPELFELRIQDGNYYGRGVFDMKFAIALYMQLVDDIRDKLDDYDFAIMITCDEELGGFDGVERLVEDEGYKPEVVVLPDGGDNWQVEAFAKGLWHVTVSAKGKSAHGSRPWEGENAIDRLMDGLQEIKTLFAGQGPDTSTLNIGSMHGGKVTNQIPGAANASLDMRFESSEDQKQLIGKVEAIAKKRGLELETYAIASVMINDPANPFIQSFMDSVRAVTGNTPKTIRSYGLTDARFFANKGIPCAIVRPPGGELHGPGEWISQKGLIDLLAVFQNYLEKTGRTV